MAPTGPVDAGRIYLFQRVVVCSGRNSVPGAGRAERRAQERVDNITLDSNSYRAQNGAAETGPAPPRCRRKPLSFRPFSVPDARSGAGRALCAPDRPAQCRQSPPTGHSRESHRALRQRWNRTRACHCGNNGGRARIAVRGALVGAGTSSRNPLPESGGGSRNRVQCGRPGSGASRQVPRPGERSGVRMATRCAFIARPPVSRQGRIRRGCAAQSGGNARLPRPHGCSNGSHRRISPGDGPRSPLPASP